MRMEVLGKPGGSRWVAIGQDHLLLLHCSTPAGRWALLCHCSLILSCLQSEQDVSPGTASLPCVFNFGPSQRSVSF